MKNGIKNGKSRREIERKIRNNYTTAENKFTRDENATGIIIGSSFSELDKSNSGKAAADAIKTIVAKRNE